MKFNSIDSNKINNNLSLSKNKAINSASNVSVPFKLSVNQLNAENIRANFSPISFRGNVPQIKNAYIITGEEDDIPLMATKQNESYLIDFDSQTEVIYGIDAIRFLNNQNSFIYDTQVIFPKKAEGILSIDGKDVPLPENSALLINEGTRAKVKTKKGFPMVIMSKKDYDWYERYGRNPQDSGIRNKFLELMYYNSHSYNGEFSTNYFLPEKMRDENFLKTISINKWESKNNLLNDIYAKKDKLSENDRKTVEFIKATVDKLEKNQMLQHREDGYVKLTNPYAKDYLIKDMKEKGFTDEEIQLLVPVFMQARDVKSSGKFALKNSVSDYSPELLDKLKSSGILFDNKTDADKNIYWKECFPNENSLRHKLSSCSFTYDEVNIVVANWLKANSTGFDLSGLKFLNGNVAVYNLNDKLNNWTNEKTNWVSNSTAIASTDGKTPFVGVSMVQMDEQKPVKMSEIRKEEVLHAHPNLEEKRQTEMYLVTSGAAALNVVKNGKTCVKILKEGELAVVGPGVAHCVNSILGEYEHIVAQLPSAFQYGFGFKSTVEPPSDYNKQELENQAINELSKLQ